MTNFKAKKVAAFALSLCMATGAVATIGYASSNGLDVLAKTANYQVSEATIGLGEDNKATEITVTKDEPAVLTLSNVPEGSYYLVIKADYKVPDETEEAYPELTYMFNTDEYASYLNYSYNYYLGYYLVTVKITDEVKTLTISAENDLVYTIEEAYFENMFIGQATDYRVENLELVAGSPVTLMLNDVAADEYFVLFNGWSGVPEGETISVKVDNGEEVILEANYMYWNGYTGNVEITDESTSITFSTTSEETIIGDVTIEKYIAELEELPEKATLSLYEPVTYTYMVTDSGYYTFNLTSDVEDAYFGIVVKTEADAFGGMSAEAGAPVYLELFKQYYIEITYLGTPYEEDENGDMIPPTAQATVKIEVEYWTPKAIEAYKGNYYVPATNMLNPYKVDMAVKNGTYMLAVGVPMDLYFMNVTVIAHIGGQVIILNALNGYVAEVTINGEDSIYLTSDYGANLVLGVAFTGEATELELGEETVVTLSGTNQTALFAMEDLEPGEYSIVIFGEPVLQVTVDGKVVINYGGEAGTFHIVIPEYDENTKASASLLIEYEGTEEITFIIVVSK